MGKKILIIGANGFIGTSLVKQLLSDENNSIRCFDRFTHPPTYPTSSKIRNISGDFFDDKELKEELDNVDILVHCFTTTSPASSMQDPYPDISLLKRNVEVFDMAIKNGVKKIVFISSGGTVYGNSDHVLKETSLPAPLSPYGICKLTCEHFLEYFKKKNSGFEYVIYRLTNPYGPGQVFKNGQGVIPHFIQRIHDEQPIVIFGDGNATRDYIYIDDATKMIADSMSKKNLHPVYNIGSGVETSLNEIVKILSTITQKDVATQYTPDDPSRVKSGNISIDLYCKEFGKPRLTPMNVGLEKTLESMTDPPLK